MTVHFHTENGMLEVGPTPPPDQADPQLINASRQPISELPGASYFDSGLSFAIMRGGHLDATVIGALQVSQKGDLATGPSRENRSSAWAGRWIWWWGPSG